MLCSFVISKKSPPACTIFSYSSALASPISSVCSASISTQPFLYFLAGLGSTIIPPATVTFAASLRKINLSFARTAMGVFSCNWTHALSPFSTSFWSISTIFASICAVPTKSSNLEWFFIETWSSLSTFTFALQIVDGVILPALASKLPRLISFFSISLRLRATLSPA